MVKRMLMVAVSMIVLVLIGVAPASAAPHSSARGNINKSKTFYRKIMLDQRKLNQAFRALSIADRQKVLAAINRQLGFVDSDTDGVPDTLELNDARCDADFDDDGVDDGDEYEDGTKPNDDDSDNDGHDDSNEVKAEGEIVLKTDQTLIIGTKIFVLNQSTVFRTKNNQPASSDDFEVGTCAEVEGHVDGVENIADKVKKEDCEDDD